MADKEKEKAAAAEKAKAAKKKFQVKAPNKEYTGVAHGVKFVDGEGTTENAWAAQLLAENGYTVTEVKEG
jgi:hypothetical protein